MKIANIMLKLNGRHEVPVDNVTPAEAQFLAAEHRKKAKGNPVTVIEGTESEVKRSDDQELARLRYKYVNKKVNAMYPAVNFSFPETFEEAIRKGALVSLPTEKFMGGEGPVKPTTGDE